MALQTENLVVIGRGILNDQPVNPIQPPLAKGIHLRYAFARERGFPWYGYHIFRRLHHNARRTCIRPPPKRDAMEPRTLTWRIPQGEFRSDVPLKLDDSFAPAGQTEFDLRASKSVEFALPSGQSAREFRITLGFYRARLGTDAPSPSPSRPTANGTTLPANSRFLGQIFRAIARLIQALVAYIRNRQTVGPAIIIAYQGTVPIAQTEISGQGGQNVTAVMTADVMDRIKIVPKSCALVEICYVPTLADITVGWQQLSDFPYPMCLPNAQGGYPCVGKPIDSAAAQTMAKGRVRYGNATDWDDGRFTEMTRFLDEMVSNGPAGGAMADRMSTDTVQNAGADDPQMSNLYPLDMLLFGSLNPAVAQVLGLYWVDQTAVDNTAYDYVVLADHDNSFHGSAAQALAAMTSGNLPANVDGWVAFNLKMGATPVLAPPGGPLCYALPGGVVANSDPNAVAPAGTNTAGLRWTLPMTSDNELLPGSAIFYHLWRADLGLSAPASAPAASAYTLLTDGTPIIVANVAATSNTQPKTASDWPPFRLFAYDRRLPDGWYSYRLAGVDLFGQFSALSDAAHWHQWAPVPDPRPWYYSGPGSNAQINPYAVHLRDTTPPPPPPGVEAYALDPLDPLLIQDAPVVSWFAASWWNNLSTAQKAGRIGVRVTWRWTKQQMLQAPDIKEFRIYFSPGGAPPTPDSRSTLNWDARIFVVAYGDHVSVDANGDRLYDVLLPLVSDTTFPGVPLAPDNTHPVVYGHIGVSAADDKVETLDNAKWQGTPFGNRTGNEGRLGVPAKIYRVLRDPPPPPGIADPGEKVWATPADYHGLSYYTFRWQKPSADAALIDAHIFRAMDEALFECDFRQRPRPPLDVTDSGLFPVAGWNAATRAAIKAELDALNAPAPLAVGDSEKTVTAKIRAALPAYRKLSDNALRTLASLPAGGGASPKPGNDGAFAQITYQPLKHTDAANADRIGPDGASTYVPSPALCAYRAEIDGRAHNHYFFRAAFVNAAHDMGDLGPSSPPVYLPKAAPPRTPAITKILGGDRQITVTFASNREPDLAEYRIYRADDARSARDIRVMTLVGTVFEPQTDPALRAKEVTWTDTNLRSRVTYSYRLVTADASGNCSHPTPIHVGMAYDYSRPAEPLWERSEWVKIAPDGIEHAYNATGPDLKPAIVLQFTVSQPGLSGIVQKQFDANWRAISAWQREPDRDLPTNSWRYKFVDRGADEAADQLYRARLMNFAGIALESSNVVTVIKPA